MHFCLHVEYPLFVIFEWNLKIKKKTQISNFMKICPGWAELLHGEGQSHTWADGWTDIYTYRWADWRDEANSLFFQFYKHLKMYFPHPTHEGIEGELWSFVACALDKGEWLNSWSGHFMPVMKPLCLLNRRLVGGPQSLSRHFGDEKSLLLLLWFEPQTIWLVAQSLFWIC